MRCISAVVLLLGLLAGLAVADAPRTRAQDATPTTGMEAGFELAPGVTAGVLAAPEDPPPFFWLRFAPGITYEIPADPTIGIVYAQSGELTLRLDAPVTVIRAGAEGDQGEPIAAGTDFTLVAGDYVLFPANIGGEARNEGSEPAQIVAASLAPQVIESAPLGTPVP